MEVVHDLEVDNSRNLSSPKDFLQITCNWQISNNKQFHEGFTVGSSTENPEKINIDDVFSLETCLSLQPSPGTNGPCLLEIKVTNRQRISGIALVSDTYTLEFFKQFGEYDKTVVAEFLDEYEGNTIYFAETSIAPSCTEASIKFTQRTCNNKSEMWIYGIKLFLTEPVDEPKDYEDVILVPEMIKFLSDLSFNRRQTCPSNNTLSQCKNILKSSKCENIETNNEKDTACSNDKSRDSNTTDITAYIDNKFHEMETRLMKKLDEIEQRTNQKLDTILKAIYRE